MITDYTTFDDVRAALGVSSDELEDATLGLKLYADYLDGELEDIDLTLPTIYDTLSNEPAPTAVQKRLVTTCRLFATFAVAKQLLAALPLFATKSQTDGKAAIGRFDNPYKDTIKQVNEQFDRQRNRLIAALAAVGTTVTDATSLVRMSVVSPDFDPVTGI